MNINKIPFIFTRSSTILFGTIEMIKDNRRATIMKFLKQVINTYPGIGIKIRHILRDRQFDCIRKEMEVIGINVNTTAHNEKDCRERIRETTNTLSFKQLPYSLIVEISYNAVFWMNCFPHKNEHAMLIT